MSETLHLEGDLYIETFTNNVSNGVIGHQVFDVNVNVGEVINKISPFVLSSYKLMLYGTCDSCLNRKN